MRNRILMILLVLLSSITLHAGSIEKPIYWSIDEQSHLHKVDRSHTSFAKLDASLMLLKTKEKHTKENIASHTKQFISLPLTETFQDEQYDYWIRIDIGSHFPNGSFICHYGDPLIIESTFSPIQHAEYFHYQGANYLKFDYQSNRDSAIYYFKLQSKHFRIPFRFIQLSLTETFYSMIGDMLSMNLFIGIILGLILMAAIYNGSMYYYNREPSLLYYTLMQLFMTAVLYNITGLEIFNESSFLSRNETYQALVSLGVAIFAILFTLSFLAIKKHIPKLYSLLQLELLLVGIDTLMTLIDHSYLLTYNIYPFLILPLLYVGFIRMRQGYHPARYYLAGWILLTLAVFSSLFSWGSLPLDPLYLGAATEAILFSLALSYKLRLEAQEKEQQRQMLIQQSRLASMGEMLGNIAHQWRQPLNHLSYTFMNLQDAQKHGELDEAYLNKKLDEGNTQLQFMSQTIEDFKGFFAPQKQKEHFSLAEATQETLEIIQNTLQRHQIEIVLDIQTDTMLHSYKNEYKQALLNLLSNAKDALIAQNSTDKQIILTLTDHRCTIQDNAGGIDPEALPRIFEPYFSTKEGGLGIGLYMTKIIIEKNMGGTLTAKQREGGMLFEIILPQSLKIL